MLLSEIEPRIKARQSTSASLQRNQIWDFVMDAHSLAREKLTEEMQQHFCASSDFTEFSAAEEEATMHKE